MRTPTTHLNNRASFLTALETSGLLTPAQMARATAALAPDLAGAEPTARFLVGAGFLTSFQADRLLAGRTDGFVLGQLVILEQLGRGSVGRVYKAKHRGMNRTVAVKVLRAELTRTGPSREAFQREVRAAAKLNHPNIVTAYDANEIGERSYLVLEFVDGPTLDALVNERGPLPVPEACELVRQAAVGLQHAHEQGMVHRDVKPRNILVTRPSKTLPGCVVKIADFGIARLAPPPDLAQTPVPRAVLSGDPDYVAPEQAYNPRTADHRADLYALGCVFYFLLTGKPPFPGGVAADKVRRHQLEQPVRVDRARPEVPPPVVEIVHRLLAKDPNARFQSAAAVAARLDGLAAAAVVAEDDGAVVSFDLPAVLPGQHSLASGFLTGMHSSPGGETSPWAQLADETAAGTHHPGVTPLTNHNSPRLPPPEGPRPGGTSWATLVAVCAGVLVVGLTLVLILTRAGK